VQRISGSFLESLLNRRLGFGVLGTRFQLAPPMPVQQTIDVGQRHAALGELLQFGAQLRGGENLALGSSPLPPLQEVLFPLLREPGPAPPSPPRAMQTFGPLLVLLGDPEPDGLLGNAQRLSHAMSGKATDGGEPD
jgi:hypothetical protein